MHQDKADITNLIELRGRIAGEFSFSHEVYGEGFYNFAIEAPRLSEISDSLPVTISERLIDSMDLKAGTLVDINGQVRSYNNYMQEANKNRLIITVFAREIAVLSEDNLINKNPNSVYLNGFICKKPVFRQTPFGREIADILLAVNRSYNKSDYVPCICWGRNAKFASSLEVSDNVKISGRLQSRIYQKKYEDGTVEDKTAYEISVSKIEFVEKDII